MAESEAISEKKVLEILTQDIQAHRDYVQRLYRNAFYVGGVGLAVGVGMAIWVLGERLDSSILQHRIDEELIQKMDSLLENRANEQVNEITSKTEEATSKALGEIAEAASEAGDKARIEFAAASAMQIDQTLLEIDQYLSDRLTAEVRESINPLLADFSQSSIDDIAQRISIPAGFVVAFDRPTGCPDGWSDMSEELRGRTIIGAVSDINDTYGFGRTGGAETHTLTISEMPRHQHATQLEVSNTVFGGVPVVPRAGGSSSTDWADGIAAYSGFEGGGNAHNNMPPYIALFYCKKE